MSVKFTLQAAFEYWKQLDCPTSLALTLLGEANMWTEVLTYEVKPERFLDASSYAKANAAVCFLKKNPVVPGSTSVARRAKAEENWWKGETQCYHANQRLARHIVSPLAGDPLTKFLGKVRRRLIDWLGNAPGDDELKRLARHGPGTTFSSIAVDPTAADKYSDEMSLTPGASFFLLNLAGTKWMDLIVQTYYGKPGDGLKFCAGNRFAVVPKTALTDRCIGIEPSVNLYFQLAVGAALRHRLRRRVGWDLDNAAAIHREMAKHASKTGLYATLDLSNASDTLCRNLVRILFRDTYWLGLLEDLRSPKTLKDQKWHVLEKFSSMGNGYTFELESCIFAAIAAEVLEINGTTAELGYNVFVFGDDIIVPTEHAALVVETLKYLGFETNPSKTFLNGSFRESCGGDYFDGEPVRGFYLKRRASHRHHEELYGLHNGAQKALERCGIEFSQFCQDLYDLIPAQVRYGGPERLGDSVLHGRREQYRWKNGIRFVKAMRWKSPQTLPWSYFAPEARLACRLTGYGHSNGIDTRGAVPQPATMWVTDS